KLNTDIGVATSGIAGPDGGTPEKPVGTVWISVSIRGVIHTRKLQLWKERSLNIQASSIISLEFLRRQLSHIN
ncbi:MAG: CinA family protein, partial [Cyclobacteriaceae bacterium]|nr:CinA family protein [Cyclobacteriaceae bacterium]